MDNKKIRNNKLQEGRKLKKESAALRGLLQHATQHIEHPVRLLLAVISLAAAFSGIVSYLGYLKDKRQYAQVGTISSSTSAQVRYLSIGSTKIRIDTPNPAKPEPKMLI